MKLIILLMSCNDKHYKEQAEISKQSIRRQIDHYKLNDYISVYDYYGDSQKSEIINTTIKLTSSDDKNHTFDKTMECFQMIDDISEYDYIFRTNTSTFINIKLLYEFIKFINPQDTVWCSELYSTFDVKCPNLYDLYPRGNGLLLSKELIELLLSNKNKGYETSLVNIMFENQNMISDDACIGTILNMCYENESMNHIKSFTHGWYKSYDMYLKNTGNELCTWDNEICSYDFIKLFITIQVKDYTDTSNLQEEKFNELTDLMINNEFDESIIISILKYSLNPSVFLGYFSNPVYTDYASWYELHFRNKLNK